jgi:hypothetical protein
MRFNRWWVSVVLTLCGLFALAGVPQAAVAGDLIRNGNFETGDFTGWLLADQHNPSDTINQDHFYISTPGSDTPPVGSLSISFPTASNPSGGSFYAVSAMDFPGTHALLQNFVVPSLGSGLGVVLSFDMFVNDQSGIGPIIDLTGLDYTTGGTFNDNQHARVDLLRAGAGDLSTAPSDVLQTFYLGVDLGLLPNPYHHYAFDISSLVGAGGEFRLRFAVVDNLSALNLGVDNVSVQVVPEPDTLALVSIGAGLGIGVARRRRSASPASWN